MDRENQMDNPCTNWLSDTAWDNITELDKLTNFHGIITSFEQYPRDWNIWYTSSEPETSPLLKSVALWSTNIRKLAKDHKGYGSAANNRSGH
jgi:hypothetical protein